MSPPCTCCNLEVVDVTDHIKILRFKHPFVLITSKQYCFVSNLDAKASYRALKIIGRSKSKFEVGQMVKFHTDMKNMVVMVTMRMLGSENYTLYNEREEFLIIEVLQNNAKTRRNTM